MHKKFNLFAIFAILLMFASSFTEGDSSNTVTDIDGNIYHTVKIGTQTWMVENLKTTKYRNGESIGTTIPANKKILQESTPKYQWAYNGNDENVSKYGRLYTWYVVSDSRNIAPTGWHVPTDAEWTTLNKYLDANLGTSGSVAKTMASTTYWGSSTFTGVIGNDLKKNNNSGFSGLPGGYRDGSGVFYYSGTYSAIGYFGYWWTSTDYDAINAWYYNLHFDNSFVGRANCDKKYGYYVRCIRDY